MRSGTDVYSALGAKDIKPAKGLKPTAKSEIQEVDIKR